MKKVLCVFSHPDDEAFGPGGTIAKWAKEGATIHLLCATRGESGNNHTNGETGKIRETELREAAQVLGVSLVEFLGFVDGEIGNNDLQTLEKIIAHKIAEFKPDIVLTFHLNGVSGHLDHIALASATTQAFKKTNIAKKLYYWTTIRGITDKIHDHFIYFPPGIDPSQADEVVNIEAVWDTKLAAMHKHKSQLSDIERILKNYKNLPKKEYFMVRSAV